MADSQTLPELVRTAQDTAKSYHDRIDAILNASNSANLTEENAHQLVSETVAIELAAVDLFAVFESRMQRHFKRGPLARKVKAALIEAGQKDLANQLHQHYLAVNVLKHGTGASYRELLSDKECLFVVKQATESAATPDGTSTGLIDVTAPGFFDGLAETILAAYQFLEAK